MADNGVRRVVRVGTTMLSIGGVEFPRSVCGGGGGGGLCMVARGYIVVG